MELIDKSALLAEIERLVNNYDKALDYEAALEDVRNFLDTLEVKEVNLEEEYKNFVEDDPVYSKLVNYVVGKAIAKHFFELGMQVSNKAQKGKSV